MDMTAEERLMPSICHDWEARARALELPKTGVRRQKDQEAYMQGAITALRMAGLLSEERTNQIGFLVAVGRLSTFMDTNQKLYQAAALIGAKP